jgi:hypothetical protein
MTRETKVGLVVAGSFLSLVLAVLGSKLKPEAYAVREVGGAEGPEVAALGAKDSGLGSGSDAAGDRLASVAANDPDLKQIVYGVPGPEFPGGLPAKEIEPAPMADEPPPAPVQPPPPPSNWGIGQFVPNTKPSPVEATPAGLEPKAESEPSPTPSENSSPDPTEPTAAPNENESPEEAAPANPGTPKPETKEPVETTPPPPAIAPPKFEDSLPKPAIPPPPSLSPPPPEVQPPAAPPAAADAKPIIPATPPTAPPPPLPEPVKPPPSAPAALLLPPMPVPMPAENSGPAAMVKPPAAPERLVAQGPPPPLPRLDPGLQPVAAVSPPIKAPVPPRKGAPEVMSFDEHHHRVKANDTFKTICERFYNQSKYERALLLFNRNHPMGAEGCRQDPPALRPGETVFLPPVWVLEKRFANAIPGGASPPPAVNPVPPPTALVPSGKVYRVTTPNLKFIDIARQTLGDPMRWQEIYQLNPTFNPSYPLPINSLLRMPATAQVP